MKYFSLKFTVLLTILCLFHKLSQAQSDRLDTMIGQMIMIGIPNKTSIDQNDPVLRLISQAKLGGIILFEKNIAPTNSFNQLKTLITDLQKSSPIPLWISIDEEGGKVHRLKPKYGFLSMPSAQYLGNLNVLDSTYSYNFKLAETLKALGINLNYAPSVDLGSNPQNPVIYKVQRSFGATPQIVINHAQQCINAHDSLGIGTVLKHFPGHGSSMGDTHKGIVDVTQTWKKNELEPYRELIKSGHCKAVMMGHMVNKNWDSKMLPASLSAKTIAMLRNDLAFEGVIFSDDMQMQAITDYYGIEQATIMAIDGGIDVIMYGNALVNNGVSPEQLHGIIKKNVLNGKIPVSQIESSYKRILKYKLDTIFK